MRIAWPLLVAVIVGGMIVGGIALPVIAEFAYPHVFHGAGAIPKEDLTDLPTELAQFFPRIRMPAGR